MIISFPSLCWTPANPLLLQFPMEKSNISINEIRVKTGRVS